MPTETKSILQLKAEIFDILRSQQTLQMEIQSLEQAKTEKLKELAAAEASERTALEPRRG